LAAVEFALIVPVMLVTLFGISEVANYVLAARKVANVASTAADLTAQATSIDDAEMSDIMQALDVVLQPFNTNVATVVISSVVADATGKKTIDWSDALHTAPRVAGSPAPANLPANLVAPNESVIMAEVSFTYTTTFGMFFKNGMTLSDTFYLKPRRSVTVERL
jgi:Flp pilus assembly protein TadG